MSRIVKFVKTTVGANRLPSGEKGVDAGKRCRRSTLLEKCNLRDSRSQWSHVDAAILLDEQHEVSQLSNKLIQTKICLRQPELSRQDHQTQIFRCELQHAGLDDRAVPLQSRIESFEFDKHFHQTVPQVWLQSLCNVTSIGSLVPEKFDDYSLIMLHPKRAFNGF
jgi:hypothetical protein